MEPDANPRLLALPTFLGTPHIGAATQEAQLAMGRAAIEGLRKRASPSAAIGHHARTDTAGAGAVRSPAIGLDD